MHLDTRTQYHCFPDLNRPVDMLCMFYNNVSTTKYSLRCKNIWIWDETDTQSKRADTHLTPCWRKKLLIAPLGKGEYWPAVKQSTQLKSSRGEIAETTVPSLIIQPCSNIHTQTHWEIHTITVTHIHPAFQHRKAHRNDRPWLSYQHGFPSTLPSTPSCWDLTRTSGPHQDRGPQMKRLITCF